MLRPVMSRPSEREFGKKYDLRYLTTNYERKPNLNYERKPNLATRNL
jgi:hypothetical protein